MRIFCPNFSLTNLFIFPCWHSLSLTHLIPFIRNVSSWARLTYWVLLFSKLFSNTLKFCKVLQITFYVLQSELKIGKMYWAYRTSYSMNGTSDLHHCLSWVFKFWHTGKDHTTARCPPSHSINSLTSNTGEKIGWGKAHGSK